MLVVRVCQVCQKRSMLALADMSLVLTLWVVSLLGSKEECRRHIPVPDGAQRRGNRARTDEDSKDP